ncbi:MAG: MoaD/ThiS family protein [Bacteroidales bacterium]
MQIKVRLFATLREGRGKERMEEVADNTTPAHIFQLLDISPKDVAILLVNGMDGKPDQILKEGDTVSIFPPVGGG